MDFGTDHKLALIISMLVLQLHIDKFEECCSRIIDLKFLLHFLMLLKSIDYVWSSLTMLNALQA